MPSTWNRRQGATGRTPGAVALAAGWLLFVLASCESCRSPSPKGHEGDSRRGSAPAEGPDVTWRDPIEIASGGGHRGPWRMNDSEFHYVDDPTVAIAADGTVAVAWVDNHRRDIFFQKLDPEGEAVFEEPVRVSKDREVFSWLPKMAMSDDGGEVFVLWQEIVFSGGSHGGEIFFARSTDGGASFSEAKNLSGSRAGDGKGRLTRKHWDNGSLDLARGPAGELYAAWTEYEGSLWFRRSTDGGKKFAEPARIAGSDRKPARGPALATGPGRTVHLAWTVGEDVSADIRLTTSKDGGRSFGEPRVLFESPGHSDAPSLEVDREGNLHLVYAESPSGMFRRYHVLYARLPEGRPGAGEPARIAGPETAGVESARFPALALGKDGRVYVVWERYPELRRRPRGIGFAASTDWGRTFSAPSVVPGTADPALGVNGGLQGLLMEKLSAGDGGSLAVADVRFRANEASRVRLIQGRAGP